MNKSQRIYLNTGNTNVDKNIFIKLEQDIDTLEIMSLKIDTKEIYRDFNADFGVIVGRVIANDGVGIPNAKVSIFIPLKEEDENNGDIVSIYPYKKAKDKNNSGKKYNLLPRVAVKDPITGIISPKQPFGSFPTREEIVTNPTYLEVYKKYYKYSTVTNNSGDYMIFGVPTGTQTVHMSADITDIGKYSMSAASMIKNLGYPANLFYDDGITIKPSDDLLDLPNIETQEISIDIIPFWGDAQNFQIGITRQDFRIRAKIVNNFTIFGSAFTDDPNSIWGAAFTSSPKPAAIRQLYRAADSWMYGIDRKQIGKITTRVFYYPPEISDDKIDNDYENIDPENDIKLLNTSEYTEHTRDGDFALIINCNRKKVITDEFGNETPVPDDYDGGVFTEFRGFITIEYSVDDVELDIGDETIGGHPVSALRFKLKIPQQADRNKTFHKVDDEDTHKWRVADKTFLGGKLYSVARFHGLVMNSNEEGPVPFGNADQDEDNGFLESDRFNRLNYDPNWNTGIIKTEDDVEDVYQFPHNGYIDSSEEEGKVFGGNWLNFCVYLPQFGYFRSDHGEFLDTHSSTNFTKNFREGTNNPLPYANNEQLIAANVKNTRWFARSDLHYTDFIRVERTDIIKIIDKIGGRKGFTKDDNLIGVPLDGDYRNGESPCPENGGKVNGVYTNPVDTNIYFYRGYGESDCFEFIQSLGLV